MSKNQETRILIDAKHENEVRVAITKNDRLEDFESENADRNQIKGNIYLAKITRVEPSLQAAFIEYGNDKHGFLPFAEIHPDYYNIPAEDKAALSGDLIKQEIATDENVLDKNHPSSDDLTNLTNLNNKLLDRPEFSAEEQKEEGEIHENEDFEEDLDKIVSKSEEEVDSGADADENQDLSDADTNSENSRKRYEEIIYRYKIQDVIKKNQIILVQAIKEDRGTKSASFTSYISLAGRYSVLMPNSFRQSGVSRRISNQSERDNMRKIIESLEIKSGASVIIRTAGLGRSKVEIKRDYDYLVMLWNSIVKNTVKSKAPAFIHEDGDVITRSIRDLYRNDVNEILVEGEKAFKSVEGLMQMLMPNHKARVGLYKGKTSLFSKFGVEEQLAALYSPTATLASGGSIVINPTEALVSIDVNSGRGTSERSIEETATRTNLEAVIEIARQIRLRNLSGLIVIDFIDMEKYKNRRSVENLLKKILLNDKAKIQIRPISNFGLLEMSRQRLKPSLIELNTKACGHCFGRGFVRENQANAANILRTVESELQTGDFSNLKLFCHKNAAHFLLNNKRRALLDIEALHKVEIEIFEDSDASADSFAIETVKRRRGAKSDAPSKSLTSVDTIYSEILTQKEPESSGAPKKKYQKITNAPLTAEDGSEYEEMLLEKSIENIVPATPKTPGAKRSNPNRRRPNSNNNNKNPDGTSKKPMRKRIPNKPRGKNAPKGANKNAANKPEQTGILKGLWRKLVD